MAHLIRVDSAIRDISLDCRETLLATNRDKSSIGHLSFGCWGFMDFNLKNFIERETEYFSILTLKKIGANIHLYPCRQV